MKTTRRREFLKNAALTAGFLASAPVLYRSAALGSPNERVNVAVVGFHGRGRAHYRELARIPNVRVTALCDVDERLFPEAVAEVEKIGGFKPRTETDFRKLLDDPDIHAISIAAPDHWHALMTIWACQAGKDVYVEKPVSYTIEEGRKMVEAARKYNRMVQTGTQGRSNPEARAAMRLLHAGEMGDAYRAKALILKGRGSIGRTPDAPVPPGVHWDLFLGPAPYRPFNLNRFHYGWHFFWDTSTSDVGNSGVHEIDLCRWGLGKQEHPVKIHCAGGLYLWNDSDQETPNVQSATLEYADGKILEIELTNLYTNEVAGFRGSGPVIYTSKGYVSNAGKWEAVHGRFDIKGEDVRPSGVSDRAMNASFPDRIYEPGPSIAERVITEGARSHFENFIDCVRSRKRENLCAEILEGHLSSAACHLANISYRTGRKLTFDPATERFVNDPEADRYLTREYRAPYVLPEKV